MLLFPMPPLKFRTVGFPQYGFKLGYLNHSLPFRSKRLNAIPHLHSFSPKVCHSLRLSTPDPCSLIRGNSVSAVTCSALCPLLPVSNHLRGNQANLHCFLRPPKPRGPSHRGKLCCLSSSSLPMASSAPLINSSRFPS